MVQIRQQLAIEPMHEGDVPTVQEIERHIFSTPWPRNAYYRELSSRNSAYYIVLRRELDEGGQIVGYGGMWRMYEAFGFKVIGRRKGYYTDNGEDAIVMWSDSIYSPRFRRAYEANLDRIEQPVRGLRRDPGAET